MGVCLEKATQVDGRYIYIHVRVQYSGGVESISRSGGEQPLQN